MTSSDSNVIEFRPRAVDDLEAHEAARAVDATVGAPAADAGREARVTAIDAAPLEHVLEAMLFVSPTPLTLEALAEAADEDADDVQQCLLEMMQAYSDSSHGIVLERVSGGWAFRATDRARDALTRLFKPQADTKLSPSALETLAICAYLQPISRPDVARIRGVSVDAAMASLLEKGFVEEAGRGESGAVLFRTTALFERAFGLSSVKALPELEGFGPSDDDVARLREQLEQMAAARVE